MSLSPTDGQEKNDLHVPSIDSDAVSSPPTHDTEEVASSDDLMPKHGNITWNGNLFAPSNPPSDVASRDEELEKNIADEEMSMSKIDGFSNPGRRLAMRKKQTRWMAKSTKTSLVDSNGGQFLRNGGSFDVTTTTKRVARRTGSFANCTGHSTKKGTPHPDQKFVTVMCQTLPYRMRIPAVSSSSEDILIGVLSSAGYEGPSRRAAIRDTWGRGNSVYFLVSGPWTNEIASEYEENQDLIWLDTEETYSDVTQKTLLFFKVAHVFAEQFGIKYAVKTDHDSFVDVDHLSNLLLDTDEDVVQDYWGLCHLEPVPPYRGKKWKWAISREEYPEEWYPPYCLGAGYSVSARFLNLAVDHIANIRFMPFEDVAVGILAERCGILPTTAESDKLVSNFRTPFEDDKKNVEEKINLEIFYIDYRICRL